MSESTLFQLVFATAAPFWFLMILLPGWSWTRRIIGSPVIVVPPALIYLGLAVPMLGDLLAEVTNPSLAGVQDLVGTPAGTTLLWAHVIAFDLFVGRWIYLDARRRAIHPLVAGPVLLLTILLGPVGFLVHLGVRAVHQNPEAQKTEREDAESENTEHQDPEHQDADDATSSRRP